MEDTKDVLIKELNEQIEEKMADIRKMRKTISELQVGKLNSFLKGKFFKFDDDLSLPLNLQGKYIHVPDSYADVTISRRAFDGSLGEAQYDIYINCVIFTFNVSEYADETYFSYDMWENLQIPYTNEDSVNNIIRCATEITKDEFLSTMKEGMDGCYKDFFETVKD